MMKTAALLLAGSMALAACASDEDGGDSGSSGGSESSSDLKVGLAYDSTGRGDKSFNDSAFAGLQAAIDEHGGDFTELTPNADASNRAELLTQLADQGYNPIIAVGVAYAETVGEVAAQYPDVTFAAVDVRTESLATDSVPDNFTGIAFAEEQGSFLAGVAAALKTTTNHVGFVGGVQIPSIEKFEAGFVAGAQAVKPDITVDVQYISPAGDLSGFNDPAKGQIVAQGMYDAGADIVFHAAGGSGLGVFQAAAASNKRAIGVDQDQYNSVGDPALQAVIMTSMLKRVDTSVQTFIDDFVAGNVEGGTNLEFNLENDGVGLATSGGFIDDIQSQIDDYRQQIIDGEITVPTTP